MLYLYLHHNRSKHRNTSGIVRPQYQRQLDRIPRAPQKVHFYKDEPLFYSPAVDNPNWKALVEDKKFSNLLKDNHKLGLSSPPPEQATGTFKVTGLDLNLDKLMSKGSFSLPVADDMLDDFESSLHVFLPEKGALW